MPEAHDDYLAWMRDAHAMEQQALTMMNGLEARLEDYPELRDRIRTHIGETEQQARALAGLLERHDTESSMFKDAMAKLSGLGQGLASGLSDDSVVKGALGSYMFEHMEIASYRILIAAAKQFEDHEAVAVFQRSLAEEQAMADWLAAHLDSTTREYLRREMAAASG